MLDSAWSLEGDFSVTGCNTEHNPSIWHDDKKVFIELHLLKMKRFRYTVVCDFKNKLDDSSVRNNYSRPFDILLRSSERHRKPQRRSKRKLSKTRA
jgi:hypothetical protein